MTIARRRSSLGLAHLAVAALLVLFTGGLAAQSDSSTRAARAPVERVVIGSKNFTESHLLGEILKLLIESRTGLEVEHRKSLGGTLICHTALVEGEIDLYPEYTGTAWAAVLEEEGPIGDPLRTFLHVERRYSDELDLAWLSPFGFNNTYVIAMRRARAEALGVRSISDLRPHGAELEAGFSLEFLNRADGYPGLASRYELDLGGVRGMEHALAYQALQSGELDLVDAYSTDGKLLELDLRLLADDRGFFPPYDAAPVVRGDLLRARPDVRAAIESLAFRITAERMIELNHAVEEDGQRFTDVARRFLESESLLDPTGVADRGNESSRESFTAFVLERRGDLGLRLVEHLRLTLVAVLFAVLVAVPLGVLVTRSRLAERVSLGAASVVQTVPSLALLAVLIAIPGLGLTTRSAVLALTLYAILPILRNTFTGVRDVDPDLVDAARGMGLTEGQILRRVRLPIATRLIMAGIRTATVITIGFATLAAFIGAGGLGEPILTGLYLNDMRLVLFGALPAALLAIVADRALGWLEVRLTPRGLRG